MRSLFDINALIALFDPGHIHHERAHTWFAENEHFGWATCPITQNGCIRILSQPKYPNAIMTSDAMLRLRRATSRPEHEFWADSISILEEDRFATSRFLGPKQLTDIYLFGLAIDNGGRLVTFDRSIGAEAVQGASTENLVVL